MQKNTAGKWIVFAYGLPDHASDGQPITGDAAQITGSIYIDGVVNAIDDTNPTELGGGYYAFDITAAEANGDNLVIVPASSTGSVQVIGVPGAVWTRPPNFEALGIESGGAISTLNGHTAQTSDHTAGIADIPTVAEFNARTLLAGSYFDPAADTVANVTLVATTTVATDAEADIAALDAKIDTAQLDLDKLTGTDGATLATSQANYAPAKAGDNMGSVTSNLELGPSEVNAEVVDVLKADTVAEMAQQAPPTTPTLEEAIMYLYMALVHEGTVTSSLKTFSNNAGTVIWKKALSDDTTTYTEAESATGP